MNQVIDLSGHLIIVTGSNTGIGLESARQLALNGATVILACRNDEYGIDTENAINSLVKTDARFGQGRARYIKLDLIDKKSIEEFVNRFKALNSTLNSLVLNAGVGFLPKRTVVERDQKKDQLEICFATNVLGHYYLVQLLWDKIIEDNTRVVTVSSALHKYSMSSRIDTGPKSSQTPWG